ncbi:hypothetical protein D3OALGA1CA_5078 [Olavius algarvensis associated proteobacterium Delta 3]|nr:hypothetical protein D3OALGA1CA_5078 [Olavius algarvensis associated proteobacterium Delta 3]
MRTRFGDWEGDSVEGSKGSGAIASHVERKSRYLIAAKLSDKKGRYHDSTVHQGLLAYPPGHEKNADC